MKISQEIYLNSQDFWLKTEIFEKLPKVYFLAQEFVNKGKKKSLLTKSPKIYIERMLCQFCD